MKALTDKSKDLVIVSHPGLLTGGKRLIGDIHLDTRVELLPCRFDASFRYFLPLQFIKWRYQNPACRSIPAPYGTSTAQATTFHRLLSLAHKRNRAGDSSSAKLNLLAER